MIFYKLLYICIIKHRKEGKTTGDKVALQQIEIPCIIKKNIKSVVTFLPKFGKHLPFLFVAMLSGRYIRFVL
ncbi:hypothetical protein B5G10_03900 [Barnesiella sp. An55]|nr:hypothetical protein B5G10_03900 [Barnesiella sp. An55]